MTAFRGLFVRKDSTRGTTPAEARRALAGLLHRTSSGAPRQGLLSPVQVVGTTGWAYSVPAAWWVTSRGLADGVVLAGSDGVVSVPTDPAPASGSRIDIIYVLHRDVDLADANSESIIAVAVGVASGTPTAPTIPAGAMEIARATVASTNANTLAATITQTATYTGLAGADIIVEGSAGAAPHTALDTLVPSAAEGQRVYSVADSSLYTRRSGAWARMWPAAPEAILCNSTAAVPLSGDTPVNLTGTLRRDGTALTLVSGAVQIGQDGWYSVDFEVLLAEGPTDSAYLFLSSNGGGTNAGTTTSVRASLHSTRLSAAWTRHFVAGTLLRPGVNSPGRAATIAAFSVVQVARV